MLHTSKPATTADPVGGSNDLGIESPRTFSVDLSLKVISLQGLKIDRFGYSAVYVRVRCNNAIIGKTENLTSFSQLVFEDEIFSLKDTSRELPDIELIFEVILVKITGGYEIAGTVVLTGENLVNLVTSAATSVLPSVIPLSPHEYFTNSSQIKGEAQLEFKLAHTADLNIAGSGNEEVLYDISIVRAMGLAQVDEHTSTSAFYIIKVNDIEVSRCDPVQNS